jgi:hypothetical protein
MMGETLAQTLAGKKTAYQPGPWFNSAKFFDIEYQTYGQISPSPDKKKENQIYWQHPNKNCAIRLSFDPNSMKILGGLSLGIRMRHATFDQWLTQNYQIEEVIKNLDAAFFDQEFSLNYLKEFQNEWELKKSEFAFRL